MTDKKPNQLTRRQMLAGIATTAAVGAAGAVGATGAMAGSNQGGQKHQWHKTVDVLCVGSGAAALTAAVTASHGGAEVAVVEKAPVMGGTTARSGAVFWIPNNYGLRARGIDDSRTECLQYFCRYAYPDLYDPQAPNMGLPALDFERLAAFYDNGSVMTDFLREQGALGMKEWRLWGTDINAPDYLSHAPENKVPEGRSLAAVSADGEFSWGPGMISDLTGWLRERNVPLLTQHEVLELITRDGAVLGAKVRHGDEVINIRARKGVIFGTGGYAHNENMIRAHQKVFLYGSCASSQASGDFIRIGAKAGASLGNLGGGWLTQVILDEAISNRSMGTTMFVPPGDSMMLVNRYGKRVVNEHRNYNDRTRAHFEQDLNNAEYPNQFLFMVYDRRTAETVGPETGLPPVHEGPHYVLAGSSLEELSGKIRERLKEFGEHIRRFQLDDGFTDGLKETVEHFNKFAREGKDPDFQRGHFDYDRKWHRIWTDFQADKGHDPNPYPNPTMHPLAEEGPYYAIILAPGSLDTNGGPVIDKNAQVLDGDYQPIPGLYGAGNCIASPMRDAYFGAGATLGPAMTYGYIAGKSVLGADTREG